jgi:alpha-ketoglutarate-dependent taurine dioxygenase
MRRRADLGTLAAVGELELVELSAHTGVEVRGVVTHEWRTGDLVLWDTLALQHGRAEATMPGERTLRHVAVVDADADTQHPWTQVALAIDGRSSS